MTEEEYKVTTVSQRELYAKIDLLNYDFQKIDSWENVVIGEPSISNDSSSDIRRTCDINLVPIDKSFDVSYESKVWLDKYVQIYIGIKDVHSTNNIIYTNMGIYLINNPSRSYSAESNTLRIQGVDLMAKMTGLRNGVLGGFTYYPEEHPEGVTTYQIPQGTNVRQAIIDTIAMAGFTRYVVDECPFDVPNDINIDASGTVYDILKQLVDICPNYQIYFDVDGVFHYDKIPSGQNEQVMVDDKIWQHTLISYDINYNFENVKNVIEVFGEAHDVEENFGNAEIEGSDIVLTILMDSIVEDGTLIGFVLPHKVDNPHIKLNDMDSIALLNNDKTYAQLDDEDDVYYVAKYKLDENGEPYWYFLGHVTPYGTALDDNPNSPFYVNGTCGRIRIVLSGGDYSNIYTDDLARQRARWELYNRCKLQDSINITCVPIYWLDVNWLVEITLPNQQGTEETNRYIIKSISTSAGSSSTQSISLMRYYPYYADI